MRHGMNKGGMTWLLWSCMALLFGACASMGRLEGGARDETPPVFLRSDPMPGATGVNKTRLTAVFDENIQLEDAFNKVIVSPAQTTPPRVSSNGRRLSVEFQDTLIPNTTYTVDFADAIKDLNEGNILDGFAIDFSTGDVIDSLRISGMVLQAENLEPAQGMLVGVYSNLSDTALTTLPLERVARTNQYGQFTIRNLKPGAYRVFAINDINRDYHWDRSEDIAFYDSLVVPEIVPVMVTDTLYAANGEDSIVTRQGVSYLPNDILLTWFNVGYKPLYMLDHKRDERRRININFSAPVDTLPEITIVDGAPGAGREISEWARLKANATRDSLEYWIADTAVVAADSLRLAVRYLKTDTTDQIVWTTDTIRFFFRDLNKKKDEKKKKKKDEEERPLFTVDSVTGDTTFLPPPDMEYLSISAMTTTQDINRPFMISVNVPIENIDDKGVHLEIQKDTVWTPVPFELKPDSLDPLMRRYIDLPWTGGDKYRFSVDTLAFTSIYATWNRPFSQEFSIRNLEDYSNLKFTLPGLDSIPVVVELLSSSDEPQYRSTKAAGESTVDFRFLNPGTYYARLFIDSNGNGKWDTGNPVDSVRQQPEEVYYFAKKLNLKKNWDVEQTWIVDELPVDAQKPNAIKKNKPKLKRGEQAPQDEEEEEDGMYDSEYNPFDKTGRNNRNRRGTNGSSTSLSGSGMRQNTFR